MTQPMDQGKGPEMDANRMPGREKPWIAAAAANGAGSVIMGAFTAHSFDPVADARAIDILRTGSLYEMTHALAILGVTALIGRGLLNDRLSVWSRWLFLAGAIIFPGALYVLALGGPRWLGALAPVGGLAFIFGWTLLAASALFLGNREGKNDGT